MYIFHLIFIYTYQTFDGIFVYCSTIITIYKIGKGLMV